jgi:N-glycosylase/DNA lyase
MSSNHCLTIDRIENTIMKVCDFVDSQKNANCSWKNFSEEQLWIELVSCILGSRVRYETAKACTKHLANNGFLTIAVMLKNPEFIEAKIETELNRPIYPPFSNNVGSRYRYSKSKSNCILTTAIKIYVEDNISLNDILDECNDGMEARDVLINKCKGIGPKQASLFLRNIGFSDDLAILDCHVDRYMELLQLGDRFDSVRKESVHPYFRKENMLRIYAISKKRSLSTLDIGIWTVMRLIDKEAKI